MDTNPNIDQTVYWFESGIAYSAKVIGLFKLEIESTPDNIDSTLDFATRLGIGDGLNKLHMSELDGKWIAILSGVKMAEVKILELTVGEALKNYTNRLAIQNNIVLK